MRSHLKLANPISTEPEMNRKQETRTQTSLQTPLLFSGKGTLGLVATLLEDKSVELERGRSLKKCLVLQLFLETLFLHGTSSKVQWVLAICSHLPLLWQNGPTELRSYSTRRTWDHLMLLLLYTLKEFLLKFMWINTFPQNLETSQFLHKKVPSLVATGWHSLRKPMPKLTETMRASTLASCQRQ